MTAADGKRPMPAAGRRIVVVLLAATVVVAGAIAARHIETVQQLEAVDARVAAAEAELADAHAKAGTLDVRLGALESTHERYGALLEARPAFVDAVAEFEKAAAEAEGVVDADAAWATVHDAQDAVLAERVEADAVAAATDAVLAEAEALKQAIADYEAEQARQATHIVSADAGASTSPVVGGYARVRAALNNVGGGHVPLQEFDGACGGIEAAACALSSGVILYTPAVAGWSDGKLHWAMAHELAHIHQFAVWNSLTASGGYTSLFGGNAELLANCMAAQRGYGWNTSCSGAQLTYAAGVWRGQV